MELSTELLIFLQLLLALSLGGIVGLERTIAGKTAGVRTFALVSMGSALFVIASLEFARSYIGIADFDPLRVFSSIVSGIGFLGAGIIIFNHEKIHGLTTAAGLWVAAAIGSTVGFGYYWIAVFTTFLTLFTFVPMWYVEDKARTLAQKYAKEDKLDGIGAEIRNSHGND